MNMDCVDVSLFGHSHFQIHRTVESDQEYTYMNRSYTIYRSMPMLTSMLYYNMKEYKLSSGDKIRHGFIMIDSSII